jgi:hypothetical protein
MQKFSDSCNLLSNYNYDCLDSNRRHEYDAMKMILRTPRVCTMCNEHYTLYHCLGMPLCTPYGSRKRTRDHLCCKTEDIDNRDSMTMPMWMILALYTNQDECIRRLFSQERIDEMLKQLDTASDSDTVVIPRVDLF